MFGLAARVVVGAVAAAAGAVAVQAVGKKMKAMSSNECQLCGKELSGIVRAMKCCGLKLHLDCLRAYVQSLESCPIKCPGAYCGKIVTLDEWERRDLEVPVPTDRIYYCHNCDSIVTQTKPRVLPCTHRFCVGCIRQCMVAKVGIMGEEPRCPMEACGQVVSNELFASIMRWNGSDQPSIQTRH